MRDRRWRWLSLVRRQTANLMSLSDPGVRIPPSTPSCFLRIIIMAVPLSSAALIYPHIGVCPDPSVSFLLFIYNIIIRI